MADSTFSPTYLVPDTGLVSFARAGAKEPGPKLDPGLEVTIVEWQGDWARIVCSNGWTAWVNGRLLVPVAAPTAVLGEPGRDGFAPVIGGDLASLLAESLTEYAT